MTALLSIAQAFEQKLAAMPAIADAVYRAKTRPMPEQHSKDICVRLVAAIKQNALSAAFGNPQDFETTITVECRARSTSIQGDEAVDALLAAVNDRLQLDPQMGGQAMDINLQFINYDFDNDADNTAVAILTYAVLHRTTDNQLN